MKTIQVAAAVIKNEGKILATQRGYGDYAGGWEFPGGKLEPGEDGTAAIVREVKEELAADIAVDQFVCTVEYDYPTFHLTMHCYLCHLVSGNVQLLEHSAARWLDVAELDSVDWLPADVDVVRAIKAYSMGS